MSLDGPNLGWQDAYGNYLSYDAEDSNSTTVVLDTTGANPPVSWATIHVGCEDQYERFFNSAWAFR